LRSANCFWNSKTESVENIANLFSVNLLTKLDFSKNYCIIYAVILYYSKKETYFRHSDCFNLTLDAVTGKYTRKVFFSNKDVPTAMPRMGAMVGSSLYIVGRDDRIFGRTKVAVAKITADK